MLLREMFEAGRTDADAAFAFGRFNPAHQGHIEVYKAVEAAGKKWFIGTNPNTHGPNDPLTFEEKSAWMQAIYPPIKGHILPEQSVVTLASKLYEMLGDGKTIAYVTDSNDWAWAGKLLNDYNGKEGPHGYYKFNAITHVESPRVSSATALRTAARANDEAAFYAASGTDPKLTVNGKTYFDTVVSATSANPEKVKKSAKKKEPVAAEGSMGISKNKETKFHAKLDKLVHNTFGKRKDEAANAAQQAAIAIAKKKKEGSLEEYGDTAKGQKMLTKVQKRAVDRVTSKKADTDPAYAKKNKDTADRAWDRMKDVAEGESKAIAQTAKRLTDPKDGAVAKLRAAGDKRREDQLKGRDIAKRNENFDFKASLKELSNNMLGKYKKAASADASKADKEGDFKRGDKRFSGIVKATKKQFDNDAKGNK